jgi:hypothetical protein
MIFLTGVFKGAGYPKKSKTDDLAVQEPPEPPSQRYNSLQKVGNRPRF